jgi:hypothetical protein
MIFLFYITNKESVLDIAGEFLQKHCDKLVNSLYTYTYRGYYDLNAMFLKGDIHCVLEHIMI